MNTKKEAPPEKKACQQTLRLSKTMKDEILKSCELSGISFMDWVRGACQERLDREKYDMNTPVAKMTIEELKQLVQKVVAETEVESHVTYPSGVARYDRILHNQAYPFDMLDEFAALETEEEREEWAAKNLYELQIDIDYEVPEGMKIYGVLQGRIVYMIDGEVGFARFDQMFPDTVEVPEEEKK